MLELYNEGWQQNWEFDSGKKHELGAIFTKSEIVRLILDLAGYKGGEQRLATIRLLEPSCGDGAFLQEVVARLIASEAEFSGGPRWDDPVLRDALRAVDVDEDVLRRSQEAVRQQLSTAGCPDDRAVELAASWLVHTDFLLTDWSHPFDIVVGNPPYVRIEAISKPLLRQYRERYSSLTNRADLYVAFIQKGLELLSESGVLAFITANRFAKNQYGSALRRLIANSYHVRYYINLEHTQPFLSDVSAYPAIVIIDREKGGRTDAASLDQVDQVTLDSMLPECRTAGGIVSTFDQWYPDGGPWVATSRTEHSAWEGLVALHPVLEESASGTKIGIGVATGADKVFILREKHPSIESSRQIPLVLPKDITNQEIRWSGSYLIDPFAGEDSTDLVRLDEFPGLAAYLAEHREAIERRHVAKARPNAWYRTIDRIWPSLQNRPKLLIPDIQGDTTIGLDGGDFYPHHNLYWITSPTWDLNALKTILRSTIVLDQVRAYSVQMRGGSLRFQAQTLRRVRIPRHEALPADLLSELGQLSTSYDQSLIDKFVGEAFSYGR